MNAIVNILIVALAYYCNYYTYSALSCLLLVAIITASEVG